MEKYIGTKKVLAEPMNEKHAANDGFARSNDDNHEWRDGYHVRYINPDGSTYDSWSPKDVFERAYKRAETSADELRIELEDAQKRFDELCEMFAMGSIYLVEKFGLTQSMLITEQRAYMRGYIDVLRRRLKDIEESRR